MKSSIKIKRLFLVLVSLASVATLLSLSFCGGGSSTGSGGGGGGGGTREFASGNMNPGATYTHTFNTAKVVPYYCQYHGNPGGVGMSGVITVNAAGTPNTHNLSISSNSDLPDLTIEAGDAITWTNNTNMAHTVESDN